MVADFEWSNKCAANRRNVAPLSAGRQIARAIYAHHWPPAAVAGLELYHSNT